MKHHGTHCKHEADIESFLFEKAEVTQMLHALEVSKPMVFASMLSDSNILF